jgi:hypothetical protein
MEITMQDVTQAKQFVDDLASCPPLGKTILVKKNFLVHREANPLATFIENLTDD